MKPTMHAEKIRGGILCRKGEVSYRLHRTSIWSLATCRHCQREIQRLNTAVRRADGLGQEVRP